MIARLAHAPDELRPVCRDVYFNPRYRQVNVFCFKRMKQMYMRMSTVDGYVEVRGFIHVSKRGRGLGIQRFNLREQDRKRVGRGKSVSVSVNLGGCRIIKKKKK